jgi:hypothetical protein
MRMRSFARGTLCLVAMALAAPPAARAGANLLVNPGFESGRTGWSWRETSPYWGDFSVVGAPVHAGRGAAHLRLYHTEGLPPRPVEVYGVLQELHPTEFPERISGWYRVEGWEKSAPATKLYLQAVVIVWGDPRTGALVSPEAPDPALTNYQVRFYLAGLEEPAFQLSNARVEILKKGPPAQGEWVHFELPLRRDFERLWGTVPERYDHLSVLFEARWDDMPAGSSVKSDVYYDDLAVE